MIPDLITTRLLLRPLTDADLNFVHQLHVLPETDEFNTLGIPAHIMETQIILTTWVADNVADPVTVYTFVIVLRESKKAIGLMGLRKGKPNYKNAEVWYKLHPTVWGNGYATEALKELINFGFSTLQLHRIEAGCASANIGSIRVLEKVGMVREGMKLKALPLKSGWADNYFYGILKES